MPKSESLKWIAMGLIVGYLGLYALDLVKNWKSEKASEKPKNQAQRNYV